jgi:radical SAM protein (TIGR01212 family)
MGAPTASAPRLNLWSQALRRQFGGRVARVSLDPGLSCPNIDGTRAKGGCVFCDDTGSFHPQGQRDLTLRDQLERGISHQRRRFKAKHFIAYLQAHSNTHAPLEQLRSIFAEALDHPEVVGLAIGTRPDCLPDDVLDHLAEIDGERPVWLEIGLESAREETLRWMNRAHTVAQWEEAVDRAKARSLHVSTHLILGCPTDTRADWIRAAELITRHRVDGLKMHMLYVTRRAPLAREFERNPFPLLTREEYAAGAVDVLEHIPGRVEIMRLVSECPAKDLIAPRWLGDRRGTLDAIKAELERRGSRQGALID